MKQLNKLLSAFSTKTLMLSFFALLPTMASAQCPDNNHPHMIDLGLPSGTKWACCNVGASKPEDYGGYFAWGETEEKGEYSMGTYIHWDASQETCHDIGKDIAGTDYDVAHVKWGGSWVMPNLEQITELLDKCTSEWTTENGVNGRRFTGTNGASIFLPAAGYRWNANAGSAGERGDYWSSSLNESDPVKAFVLRSLDRRLDWYSYTRDHGQSVRPVAALSDQGEPEPYAVLSDGGQTVTFYYDDQKTTRGGFEINNSYIDWDSSSPYGTATTAVFDASFANYRPVSTAYWFMHCSSLTTINGIGNLKTETVKDMSWMFFNCSSLTSLDVSGFDTSNVTYMNGMFCCSGLTNLDLSNFNTSNVMDMGQMFWNCHSLTSLNLSGFNTSNVMSMAVMFCGCYSLTSLDVSGFNTSNVTNMNNMFSGCSSLTILDVSSFNTSNVTDMHAMFWDCSNLTSLDVSGFNTSNVTDMRGFFYGCSGLTTIFADEEKWSTASVIESDDMFTNSTSLVGGNGTVYDANYTNAEYARIDKPEQPGYFTQKGASSGISIDETTFPDENFRNWVLAQDYGQDGVLTEAEIAGVTEIYDVAYKNITSLQGIEYFTALTYLSCDGNQLASLDVSHNTVLMNLYCDGNKLTSLDVSRNIALTDLSCQKNKLTSLDVTMNTALTKLNCYGNQLSSLDVSQNTALTELVCYGNQLTSLDVSKNTALKELNCPRNQLTSLDLSKNTALECLICYQNQLTSLDVSKNTALRKLNCYYNQLTSLDVSMNTALTELSCYGNQLTSLDVSQNTALTELSCGNYLMTSLDVSKNTALTVLSCGGSQLTSLDVSQNTALTRLICDNNRLTSLDVSKNTALTELYCYSNQINETEMENLVESLPENPGEFYVKNMNYAGEQNVITTAQVAAAKAKGWTVYALNNDYNWVEYDGDASAGIPINSTTFPDENFRNWVLAQDYGQDGVLTEEEIAGVTSIDVSDKNIADLKGIEYFTELKFLNCYDNQLISLDVSMNTALIMLNCFGNQLTSLDVSMNMALIQLSCSNNQLTSLDLSRNTTLATLGCGNNKLTSLDISQNTALTSLSCDYTQLTSLDVSHNTALIELTCYGNQLTTLDVSQNTALEFLQCGNNQLTMLDVTKNISLTRLYCHYNQLTSLDVSKNTALTMLLCHNNQLTSLDFSRNTVLEYLDCYCNNIKGAAMDALIASLPGKGGSFYAISPSDEVEQNVVTKAQVAAAKEKGWKTYYYSYETWNWEEYEGSEQEMDPISNGETIDIGNEIDENTSLDGNVVGDVYYSISSGDGNYDAAEGCLVVTKPTDDSAIDGQDIFGEDFKDNYTGIVFKLAPGKGSIKVEAETQGNMVLKVKIGNSEPIEMELDGKLKVKFPYNVSEETLVYIYGGLSDAAGAKGTRASTDGNDLLKIYGFEIVSDPSGIDAIENGQQQDAPVYNLNGQRVNTHGKGIYIKNGRKVLMK